MKARRSRAQKRYLKRRIVTLTRKRSLVQIQYGPRYFSKLRLALRAKMRARLLRFCPISAGHGAGIPASTQGVPAVSVSSKPIAADAIECGNHAASRTSRTVNAHVADSVLEVCLGATPVHGVHIGDSGAKPLPSRKGLTGLRLCEAFTVTRRQPFQPITTCQHFPGGQALTTRANGEEGLRARGRHPGGRRRVVHSPVHY